MVLMAGCSAERRGARGVPRESARRHTPFQRVEVQAVYPNLPLSSFEPLASHERFLHFQASPDVVVPASRLCTTANARDAFAVEPLPGPNNPPEPATPIFSMTLPNPYPRYLVSTLSSRYASYQHRQPRQCAISYLQSYSHLRFFLEGEDRRS